MGLCARAVGHGLRTCYVSFHKNPEKYGYNEIHSLKKLGVTVMSLAKGHPHLNPMMDVGVICQETLEGLGMVKEWVEKEKTELLVLDEILISIRDKFLDEEILLDFIKNKPKDMELVLTGRGATPNVLGLADYVSNVDCVSHPYDKGVASRKGIEF